ncbi:hypothetical protein ACM66B_006487 [Microbotryomycetes sp. NB124-2]
MKLNQATTAELLRRANSDAQVEEVLHAYCLAKQVNGGNVPMILRKLHLLTLYLRAVDLGHIVRDNYAAFAIVAYTVKSLAETSSNDSTTLLASIIPTTDLGIQAFNIVLAKQYKRSARRPAFLRSWSSSSNSASSDVENVTTLRSRSSNVTLSSVAIPTSNHNDTADQGYFVNDRERARRIAGAGAVSGTGLLSAPPQYERGGVAAYVEQYADVPAFGRSSLEELPSYVRV